jgi:hypothetical protein
MNERPNPPLTKRQIIVSVCIGVSVYLLVPGDKRAGIQGPFVNWAVPLLLLGGAYVVFKSRKDDIKHYEAIVPKTELGSRGLAKRGRYLLIVSGGFALAGSIILVRLLLHTFG